MLYFGYLAAIKTQNGAAMSVGRISTFLDIYIERDLQNGTLTEKEAQELVDHMVMKFRMVKFARIPSYNQLFSGDPVWATLEVAGMGQDGRSCGNHDQYRGNTCCTGCCCIRKFSSCNVYNDRRS